MFRMRSYMAALTLMLFAAIVALGQGTTGNISGTVTDQNGAVIPGATVKATNTETNQTRETVSGNDGRYSFQLLQAGNYRVEVSSANFQLTTRTVIVNITQTTTADVVLGVGAIDPNEVLVETLQDLQVESSQQGRVIGGETLRQLPLPTRNFQQLLTLSSGAQSSVTNSTELGRGDAVISVNGQRTTSNSVKINGIDANSIGTNSTPNIAVPATDSLQEFVVQTSMYDASNGRNAGGNIEAITRSGGNQIRGNVYYFLRDTSLNANESFVKGRGLERPELSRHQLGGTIGGPLIKDKVFFFGSYQHSRERNGLSLANSLTFPVVPAALTDGNRTAAGLAAAFGLTPALVSPVAVNILNTTGSNGDFLIPSGSGSGLGGTPIVQSGLSRFRENQFNFNGDFNFTSKHSLAAKFFIADNPTTQANYNFAGLGNGQSQLVGFGGDLTIKQKLYSITDTYIISPNIVNQARFGFNRLRVTSVPEESISAAEIGITNPLGSLYPGAPTLSIAGFDSGLFYGSSTLADQSSRINGYTFSDTLSWTTGNHRLRFGAEYRFSQVKFYFNAFSRGQIIYADTFNTSGVRTATAFQNFLMGIGTSLIGSGVFDRYYKVQDFSGFVQDDWRVAKNLTINLGVRYDLYGLPSEDQGRLVNFLPDQMVIGTPASPAPPPNGFVQAEGGPLAGVPEVEKTLVPVDKNNIAPRIGFAYDIMGDQRAVIRGGYGIYFDRISTRFANTQLFNAPYFALGVGVVNTPLFGFPGIRNASDPFIPLPLPSAFPVAPTVPSPISASVPFVGVPISGVWVDPNMRTPYVQQFNIGSQFQIGKGWVGEIGYVGNKGTKLLQVVTLNQPVYNATTNTFTPRIAPATVLSANKNNTGGNQQVQTTSLSNYHSLQASVSRRFGAGQFLAAYTYGKSKDYYSGGTVNELTNTFGDQWDWRTNYGPSDFNRDQRFVVSGTYDLPKFVSESNSARWLVNDWQMAGIAVFQTGLPYSIVDSNGTTIIQRANVISGNIDGSGDANTRLNQYFNTSAFATSRHLTPTFDPSNPFGNSARNLLVGPGQKNIDISFIKMLPFTEKVRGEFRAEMFNVFNWVNYANPGNAIGTATFGRITSATTGPRVIQFAFKLGF